MVDLDSDRRHQAPFGTSWEEVLRGLGVSRETGLSRAEVRRRRARYGANRLREARRKSAWSILLDQFKSVIVLFLFAAAAVSLATADYQEALAIGAVVLINGCIGFFSELQAVRSMEALRKLGRVPATVRRDGEVKKVPAEALVPGDIVLVEGGDVVTADLRLIEASKLQADEAALTGESAPVDKSVEPLPPDTSLPERANMLFKGTAVARGAGAGIVVATGMGTELGNISALVEESLDTARTPLEKRLDRLGNNLIWLTLLMTVAVAGTGILAGRAPLVVAKTAIALAVAAIPEGLPIVATLALARGMWRMAKKNAVINRLSAVETLGATDYIFTDKTGTLTEGKMTVRVLMTADGELTVTGEALSADGGFERGAKAIDLADHPASMALLEVGVLCNDASWDAGRGERGGVGDPIEVALLVAGAKAGLDRTSLLRACPEEREVAFDPDVKMMATYHRADGGIRVAVKGAPEAVLEASTAILLDGETRPIDARQKAAWLERNRALAARGLRVLALAQKLVPSSGSEPYEKLCFLGFVGLVDPPRNDVRDAVAACRAAGIRLVMLTGDQVPTARYVGREVGLLDDRNDAVLEGHALERPDERDDEASDRILRTGAFARVTPKQKLDLVRLGQSRGHIVAMTGDGVNDAPALSQADIGIAMGKRGTQVAREASDMILRDDAFSTIVAAVEQGRIIFRNIRTFIRYLISCNVSEILVVFLATIANAPLPITPLQILFLNLVTDVFPALALGLGEGSARIMREPPRDPSEPILTRTHWLGIGGYGLLLAFSVIGALAVALLHLGLSDREAVTISFLTLAMAQLWHVFNMRERGTSLVDNAIVRNPYVWGALLACALLVLAAVHVPWLSAVLETTSPDAEGWILAVGMSLLPLFVGQVGIGWSSRRATGSGKEGGAETTAQST